jgi:hypothetical protein
LELAIADCRILSRSTATLGLIARPKALSRAAAVTDPVAKLNGDLCAVAHAGMHRFLQTLAQLAAVR